MTEWRSRSASYVAFHRSLLDDPQAYEHAQRSLLRQLDRHLRDEIEHPLGPIECRVSVDHSGFETRDLAVLLAEVPVLRLKHPNPLPVWRRLVTTADLLPPRRPSHYAFPGETSTACCGRPRSVLPSDEPVNGFPFLATCCVPPSTRLRRLLDGTRGSWSRGPWSLEVRLGSVNRPHLDAGWSDENEAWVCLSWGNGGSDPVWSLAVRGRPPRWACWWVSVMNGR